MTKLLTIDEVTERLRVSRRTVATLIATRELPSVVIGARSTRVMLDDLEEYLANQRRAAEPIDGPEASRARVRAGKPKARSAS